MNPDELSPDQQREYYREQWLKARQCVRPAGTVGRRDDDELRFASPEAERLYLDSGLSPDDLSEPSGKTGYTKSDVELAASED